MESYRLFPFETYAIGRPLKQLLKVSVRCHSEEYLLGKFYANYYQSACGKVYFEHL